MCGKTIFQLEMCGTEHFSTIFGKKTKIGIFQFNSGGGGSIWPEVVHKKRYIYIYYIYIYYIYIYIYYNDLIDIDLWQ